MQYIVKVFGLFLLCCLLTSCEKITKVTLYNIYCDTAEYTPPTDVTDPALHDAYMQLLDDLMSDLVRINANDLWQVDVINDNFGPEDAKAEAAYARHLPEVKDLESKYKKRIEDLSKGSSSSFYIKVVYTLSRSVPADYSSATYLQEYHFELRY